MNLESHRTQLAAEPIRVRLPDLTRDIRQSAGAYPLHSEWNVVFRIGVAAVVALAIFLGSPSMRSLKQRVMSLFKAEGVNVHVADSRLHGHRDVPVLPVEPLVVPVPSASDIDVTRLAMDPEADTATSERPR